MVRYVTPKKEAIISKISFSMFEGKRAVFWDVTLCILIDGNVMYEAAASIFYPENGSRIFLRNLEERLSKYTASHPRKP
jgi:hypothetical protein